MENDLSSKGFVDKFIKGREQYLKSHITENRFYSEKYQFLFGLMFTNENNKSPNCAYTKVKNLEDCFEILKELEVYEIERANEKLYLLSKDDIKGANFPCYLALCEKFMSFDS